MFNDMILLMEEALELLKKSGMKLAELAAHASFGIWQKEDFRNLIYFNQIGKKEQDRIFNELELTVLGLFILNLDRSIFQGVLIENQKPLKFLQKEIKNGFLNLMASLGIEQNFVDLWKGLIDMRISEYRKNYKLALKTSKTMNELKNSDDFRIIWARVETLTICSLNHIRRGNVKKDDPLWRYLKSWLLELDEQFSKIPQPLLKPFIRA